MTEVLQNAATTTNRHGG